MKNRRSYSGSLKARVVSELVLKRKCLDELAAEYQVHPNLIKNWKTQYY